jgi:poly(A) polymerase
MTAACLFETIHLEPLHFEIEAETAAPLCQLSSLIADISGSRLFEEMIKLFQCGEAESVQRLLVKYDLFSHLFAQTNKLLNSNYPVNALLSIALESTDTRIRENKPVTPAFVFAILLWFPLMARAEQLRNEGMDPLPALEKAMSQVITEQNKVVTIPKRFTQVMREIWLLQYRFPKRLGHRAFSLLEHPRFRAAYDFLALRALAGDESMELAEWWTKFQEVDAIEQEKMVSKLAPTTPQKPIKKRPKEPRNE